jgi:hypothetical protein
MPCTNILRFLCHINRRAFDSGLFRGFGDDGMPLAHVLDPHEPYSGQQEWVGTGCTAELCLPIPPVVTVRAAFTAHGDRLSGSLPSFLSAAQPGFPGIQGQDRT